MLRLLESLRREECQCAWTIRYCEPVFVGEAAEDGATAWRTSLSRTTVGLHSHAWCERRGKRDVARIQQATVIDVVVEVVTVCLCVSDPSSAVLRGSPRPPRLGVFCWVQEGGCLPSPAVSAMEDMTRSSRSSRSLLRIPFHAARPSARDSASLGGGFGGFTVEWRAITFIGKPCRPGGCFGRTLTAGERRRPLSLLLQAPR